VETVEEGHLAEWNMQRTTVRQTQSCESALSELERVRVCVVNALDLCAVAHKSSALTCVLHQTPEAGAVAVMPTYSWLGTALNSCSYLDIIRSIC